MERLNLKLQHLVRSVATKNGFGELFEITIEDKLVDDGQGYIGIIWGLCIKNKDDNGKILNLVVKSAPTSDKLRSIFPTREAFLSEIFVYQNIFKEINAFQEERKILSPFNNICQFYGFIDEKYHEVLLLENLKTTGFSLHDRKKTMDFHHLSLGVKTYAKLHAVSHAMKLLEPKRYDKWASKLRASPMVEFFKGTALEGPDKKNQMAQRFYSGTLDALDEPHLIKAFEPALDQVFPKFFNNNMYGFSDDGYFVFAHLDCWNCNILFKYEDKSKPNIPTDLKLIDWQTSFVTHPMCDLTYFLLINAGKEDLDKYLDYLEIYYQTLTENLKQFKIDASTFYPFETLKKHWIDYVIYGFFMCQMMLRQSLSEEKTHDFEKIAEEGLDVLNINFNSDKSDLFRKRMSDLVQYLIDINIL